MCVKKKRQRKKTFRLGYGPVDLAEAKLATSGLAVLMVAAPELVTDWTVAAPSAPTVKRNEIKKVTTADPANGSSSI